MSDPGQMSRKQKLERVREITAAVHAQAQNPFGATSFGGTGGVSSLATAVELLAQILMEEDEEPE